MTYTTAPAAVEDLWPGHAGSEVARLTDEQLLSRVAASLSVPRAAEADSFVLHAPLELAARAVLLPHVPPADRARARLRLVVLAGSFEAWGQPVPAPVADSFDTLSDGARVLLEAIDRGELDDVDAASAWLGRAASPRTLRRLLAPGVVQRTSAAAHASIFLYHLPRLVEQFRQESAGTLLRSVARELARHPDWRIDWVDRAEPRTEGTEEALVEAVRSAPSLGIPGSTFIHPVMAQVDQSGVAADLLASVTGGTDVSGRAAELLRLAAWSMLEEPPDHAPYGWSHCLTIPQAVLGVGDAGDASLALAVAATHVVGFRAALAVRPLDPAAALPRPEMGIDEAMAAGPDAAASAAWHLPRAERPVLWRRLATIASTGHDAHLVKYTVACLDAASADPAHERLFLAAAASLAAWWAEHPAPDDPLAE